MKKECKHINIIQVGSGTHTEHFCADCNDKTKSVKHETPLHITHRPPANKTALVQSLAEVLAKPT